MEGGYMMGRRAIDGVDRWMELQEWVFGVCAVPWSIAGVEVRCDGSECPT